MALINPEQENSKAFNPNVDNSNIAPKAGVAGKILIYMTFILIIPIFMYLSARNNLVKMQFKINEASSGIDVQLKKRRDMLIKLLDATKGEMDFEKSVMSDITKLRTGKMASAHETMQVTDSLSSAFNVNVENYPDLKSSHAVQKLMEASEEVELEIAATRRLYNSNVNQFNTKLFVWPSSVIATDMGLHKLPLFAASSEDKKDVKLTF